jgi:predicted ribosome quality control (RQC) complex YloA/Tae2 family protein
MESQQRLELLLRKMKTDKEEFLAKLDVNQKKADIMLAKLDANQEKAAAVRKADKEEMEADIKAWREEMAAERRAIQARTEAIKDMRENRGTSHKEMVAVIKPETDVKTTACLGQPETILVFNFL